MPTGKSMAYVSGGDRMPPLTPVVYAEPRPKRTGHDWPPHNPTDPREPTMPTTRLAPSEPARAAYRGRHPHVATMIRLYVDDGLSAPAVAEAMGIAAKTVRTHLKRAGIDLRDDRTGQNLPRP